MSNENLLKAASNAAATIEAIYKWIDMIEAEGGATSIAGVAKCHAFLISMNKNRSRTETLIMKPVREAIAAHKGGA